MKNCTIRTSTLYMYGCMHPQVEVIIKLHELHYDHLTSHNITVAHLTKIVSQLAS